MTEQLRKSDAAYRSLDGLEGVPHDEREPQRLRIVVVGHVDHGKSTLIGRIFFDTDSMPEGKVEQIRRACEAENMPFEYAFLLDALLEEQEQNITIDTTRIPFRTRSRGYEIIDAPGHKEFLKNMVTGAASADAAVLVIAANEGVREQSRRHAYLLRLLGVPRIVVAVNKMDMVGYSRKAFDEVRAEYREFLSQIGVKASLFVPISAREGDNIARRSGNTTMPWYDGPTILEALDGFEAANVPEDAPLRFVTQDVYRFDARRLIVGRIETGRLSVGDSLTFYPGNRSARVASFERWNGPERDFAQAGESVAFTLDEQIFAERGHIATKSNSEIVPHTATRLRANLFWLGARTLQPGDPVTLRLATQQVAATVLSVESVVDASTLETRQKSEIAQNDVAEVRIETSKPVAFDQHAVLPNTGRFVLIQDRRVAGGGILMGAYDAPSVSARNIVWSDSPVMRAERTARNGHSGAVIWLTGLSGSGKSTLAGTVHRALFERGMQSTLLDGDNLRHGLCADLGFAESDRSENIRRAAHVAALFADAGNITLCAFISPYRADRDAARSICAASGVPFVEVFVDTPLETCEERDPKGLYRRARAGEIPSFTGIDAPYEAPSHPDLHVRTVEISREAAAERLLELAIQVSRGRDLED